MAVREKEVIIAIIAIIALLSPSRVPLPALISTIIVPCPDSRYQL